MVNNIEDIDTLNNIINNNKKIIIKFFATWCKPCKNISPYFEKISKMYNDIIFIEIDIEKLDVIKEYNIKKFPTFVFIQDKQIFSNIQTSQENILNIEINRFNENIDFNNLEDF